MKLLEPSPYFAAQRIGRWKWPWLPLGWLAAAFGALLFSLPLFIALIGLSEVADSQWAVDFIDELETDSVESATDPFSVSLNLLLVGVLCWGAAILGTLVHGLPLRSLLAPSRPFRWTIVRKVAAASLLLTLLTSLAGVVFSTNTEVTFTGVRGEQLLWLLPLVLIVLIQTSGEDVFFKGFLLHRLGAVTRLVWLAPLLITAVFVALHISNSDFDDIALIVPLFVVSELAILYLVIRTGGMEAALWLHWINNFVIFIFIADGETQANDLTFFVTETAGADGGIVGDEIVAAALYGIQWPLLLFVLTSERSPFYLERFVPVEPAVLEDPPPPSPPLPTVTTL